MSGICIEKAVAEIEAEFMKQYEKEKEEILRKLRINEKKRNKLYLCLDNNKIYFSKPRRCSSIREVPVFEYVRSELSKRLELRLTRLRGWRWLAENCASILNKIITDFFLSSKMLYFNGGYLYVAGIREPFIVVSVSKYSPEIKKLIQKLASSPFRVDVFVGKELRSYPPTEALKKLEKLRASTG